MSLEVVSQVFGKTTYVNRVVAGQKSSEALLENMYQGLVEINGRGITDRFTTEAEVNENAQIFVNRILPVDMEAREQGASVNGGSFSQNSHYTQTTTVAIPLLITVDDTIVIPGSRQRMIKTDLLAQQVAIYGDRLNTIINGATAGCKLAAIGKAELDGKEVNVVNISTADITDKKVLDRFIEANSMLDEGDIENGVDIFPQDSRIAVMKLSARLLLKASGVLVIGGANYAYDIAAGKSLSHGDKERVNEDGYIGEIDGVPVHLISNESLRQADSFCGFPKGTLKASTFMGYLASSYANARGVSTIDQIKIVDSIDGQGVILQPFTKMGVACWYPKGVVYMAREGAKNTLFTDIKALFTKYNDTATVQLKAGGSRLFPTITSLTADGTNIKIVVNAYDDAHKFGQVGSSHVVEAYGFESETPVFDLATFLKGYKGASRKGKLTNLTGGNNAIAVANGKYAAVAVLSDDGSITVNSVKYTA